MTNELPRETVERGFTHKTVEQGAIEAASLQTKLNELPEIKPAHGNRLEEYRRLETSYDRDVVRVCLAASEKMSRLSKEIVSGTDEEIDAYLKNRLLELHAHQASSADKEPWKGYAQEIREIERLSPKHVREVAAYLSKVALPEEYKTHVETYLAYLDHLLSTPVYQTLLEVKKMKTLNATDYDSFFKAIYLLRRQETYPLFAFLARKETDELHPIFDSIRDETVDFLTMAFPDIEEQTLKDRAGRLTFKIESSVETHRSWEKTSGKYNPRERRVYVKRNARNNETTYRHEILHGLSQSTENTATEFRDPELTDDAKDLLSESIIEEITQFSTHGEQANLESYVMERKELLNYARRYLDANPKNEIPLSVFVKALFSERKSLRSSLEDFGLKSDAVNDLLASINQWAQKIVTEKRTKT